MNSIDVIIIGTSHHNTLSMVRAIGVMGVSPTVLLYNCQRSFVAKSKFIKETLYFDSSEDIIFYLKGICRDKEKKPVIISCTDEIAHQLDIHQSELLPYLDFFHTTVPGALTQYMDKQKQTELAESVGFCIPWSATYNESFNKESMVFPCIIKPVASINGGKHIRICHTREEFSKYIEEFDAVDTLVQGLVPKEKEIVILGLTIDGESYLPAYIEKYREISGGTTYSKVCSISTIPSNIQEACVRMVSHIGYEGLWGIECIVNDKGYYFLELNLRNDATTYAVSVAGINLPYKYIAKKTGSSTVLCDKATITELCSMVEHNDLIYVLKHHIGLFRWWKEFRHSKCRYIMCKSDQKPFYFLLKSLVGLGLKKCARKLGLCKK